MNSNQTTSKDERTFLALKWIFSVLSIMFLLISIVAAKPVSIIVFFLITLIIFPPLKKLWDSSFLLFSKNRVLKLITLMILSVIAFISLFPEKSNSKPPVETQPSAKSESSKKVDTLSDTMDSVVRYDAVTGEEISRTAKSTEETMAELKEKAEPLFSGWDGSNRALEKYIKDHMNDRDSYKHVNTNYWVMKEYIVVQTSFRGKNSFGGVVLNSIKAKIDYDGNIIEIIE